MRFLAVVVVSLLLFASADATFLKPIRPPFHKCNWCGINAICYISICKCLRGYVGHPYFLCYKPPYNDMCQICDDPVLTTENGEHVSPHFLDSTLMMDKSVPTRSGTCRIRAVVTNYRVEGKSFPRCVSVKLELKSKYRSACVTGFKICGYSRPDGYVKWNIYSIYVIGGRTTVNLWKRDITSSTSTTLIYKGCGNLLYFRVMKGKILKVQASCCSFVLGFRPFIKRLDWLKTGIFFLTPKTKTQPKGPPPSVRGFPLCLRPGLPLSYVETNLGLPNRRDAMSYLAQTNLPTDLLPISTQLKDLKQALLVCTASEIQMFFKNTDFVLYKPPFIRDISGTTQGYTEILKVAKKSADWFCQDNVASCRSLIVDINTKAGGLLKQPKRFPKLVNFRKANCAKP